MARNPASVGRLLGIVGCSFNLAGRQAVQPTIKLYSASAASRPAATYEYIKVSRVGAKSNVGLITLDRPKALNALCSALMHEVGDAVAELDADPTVAALVLTGSERAFAAGADIKEMQANGFASNVREAFLDHWNAVAKARKPTIAAVNGYALGGGCELAMMCDIIYAGDKAKFGQPEVTIGTIPGSGGTQRLTRAIGKSRAMELVLTGRQMTAQEAERAGLVSRVFPADELLDAALKLAEAIAAHSQVTVALAKDAVNKAYESTLQQGLDYEKRLFWATFATADQKEGMKAFAEKRAPNFKNE